MLTKTDIAEHLFMDERSVYKLLPKIAAMIGRDPERKMWWQSATLDEIRKGYILHQREVAAGRGGGGDASSLAAARAEEARMKTMKMRLEYLRDIGQAIYSEDAANVINDWARYANREYQQCTHKIVSEIQAEHNIDISQEMVSEIVSGTTDRIRAYAEKLGRDLVDGIDAVHDAEDDADG